jgi:hypothetical protein
VARKTVYKDDTIVIGDYSVSAEVLATIINPDARLLWAFIEKDGRIQPVPYGEDKVIWLTDNDFSSPGLVEK